MNSYPEHPGSITFVDGNTQQVTDEVHAADVPPTIAFVELNGEFHPVVRVVAFTTDRQRIIRQYGVDGTVLNSTVQIKTH